MGSIASVGGNNNSSPRNIVKKLQCFGTKTWIKLRKELKDLRIPQTTKKNRNTKADKRESEKTTLENKCPTSSLPNSSPTDIENPWQLLKEQHEIWGDLTPDQERLLKQLLGTCLRLAVQGTADRHKSSYKYNRSPFDILIEAAPEMDTRIFDLSPVDIAILHQAQVGYDLPVAPKSPRYRRHCSSKEYLTIHFPGVNTTHCEL